MIKYLRALRFAAAGLVLSAAGAAQAQFYTENFDVDNTANWKFNSSIAADTAANNSGAEANYFFDYSTIGIPSAPGSGGTTRGLKVEANVIGTGVFSGMSTSPLTLLLPAEYKLSAYVWQNANGPMPGGGSGSTQLTNMTVGASGNDPSFAGSTLTGVQTAASGEGGTNPDYRVYSAAFPDGPGSVISPSAHPGVYNAGNVSQNSSLTYYTTNFPGQAAPAAQTTLFGQQTGTAADGTQAFKWHLWEITKTANSITWEIDDVAIATLPSSLFPSTFGSNFSLGHADINATSSTDVNSRSLLFGLFDNIVVSPIPEPTSIGLLGIAALAMLARRRS